MKAHYIDAPAHWAAMLINNDLSGLGKQELAHCAIWLLDEGLDKANFVSCDDEPSYQIFDYTLEGPLQTMMYTYTYFLED